jgi:para-nitrobenzyl esterase
MLKSALLGGLALAAVSTVALAQPAAGGAHYSTSTTQLGTLMADPAAKAVLVQDIPDLVVKGGDAVEQASGMTLREMQAALKPYSPDTLSDAKLAKIDEDLAKLPPPKN